MCCAPTASPTSASTPPCPAHPTGTCCRTSSSSRGTDGARLGQGGSAQFGDGLLSPSPGRRTRVPLQGTPAEVLPVHHAGRLCAAEGRVPPAVQRAPAGGREGVVRRRGRGRPLRERRVHLPQE